MLKLLDNYLVNNSFWVISYYKINFRVCEYVFFEHQGESFVFRMILEI